MTKALTIIAGMSFGVLIGSIIAAIITFWFKPAVQIPSLIAISGILIGALVGYIRRHRNIWKV